MDFPKSVPGVGLVGGVFVDENQATGQPGSLMAAAWGTAVTQELLNIIRAAGLEPDEAKTDQVQEAIRTLVPERSVFARRVGTNSLPVDAFGIFALADGGAAATVTLPSTVDLVGDTELLLFSDHANTAAVQIKTAVGQTVQGPAALMGASTTAFMLPLGGDWVRLRSEKALGRWVVVAHWSAKRITALEDSHGLLTITGNATLTGADNKLLLNGIVTGIQLQKGDVIQIAGAGGINAKPRTVESIVNNSELILNYEHCGARGNGPLKLQDYAGPVTITRLAKWFNAAEGLGQAWVSVAAFRSINVPYTNSTGRTIQVSGFGTTNGGVRILNDGVKVASNGYNVAEGLSIASSIGADSVYKFEINVTLCMEKR